MSALQLRICTHMFKAPFQKIASINGAMPTAVALASSVVLNPRSKMQVPAKTLSSVVSSKTNEAASHDPAPQRIVRLKALLSLLSLSRSTVYNRINPKSKYYESMFPKPVRLGSKAVGWILEDVYAYIEYLRQ